MAVLHFFLLTDVSSLCAENLVAPWREIAIWVCVPDWGFFSDLHWACVLVLSHFSVKECEGVLEPSSGTQLGLSLLASRLHRDSMVWFQRYCYGCQEIWFSSHFLYRPYISFSFLLHPCHDSLGVTHSSCPLSSGSRSLALANGRWWQGAGYQLRF